MDGHVVQHQRDRQRPQHGTAQNAAKLGCEKEQATDQQHELKKRQIAQPAHHIFEGIQQPAVCRRPIGSEHQVRFGIAGRSRSDRQVTRHMGCEHHRGRKTKGQCRSTAFPEPIVGVTPQISVNTRPHHGTKPLLNVVTAL